MTVLADTTDFIAGIRLASVYNGRGVLGSNVTGANAAGHASLLFRHITLPADANIEFRIRIISADPNIVFYEDSSGFWLSPPDGSYPVQYEVFAGTTSRGIFTDTIIVGGTVILVADTASVSDALQLAVTASLTDGAVGNDGAPDVGAQINLTDSATGADSVSRLVQLLIAVSDSASAADVISINAVVASNDVATGVDAAGIQVQVVLADAVIGADAATALQDTIRSFSDNATAVDSLSITTLATVSDSATATDTPSIAVTVAVSDALSAADAVSRLSDILRSVTDTANATDTTGVTVTVSVNDAISANDVPEISVNIPITDSATGADSAILSRLISVIDSAGATDIVTQFDNVAQIATITFTLSARRIDFSFPARSIELSFREAA